MKLTKTPIANLIETRAFETESASMEVHVLNTRSFKHIVTAIANMNLISELCSHAISVSKSAPSPSTMEKLPQDILVLILQSIDSLRSLRAAVLASSAMYDAFRTAKIETLACVVSHSRPQEVAADAVALSVLMNYVKLKSKVARCLLMEFLWTMQKESTSVCKNFIWIPHTLQEKWGYLPRDLSSPQLLHFHWFIEYFTEKLFKSAMRYVHQKGWSGTDKLRFRKLSHSETIRIQRALYRLEFVKLFMRLDELSADRLKQTAYWRRAVTVWEMEEIACVKQLLYQRLVVLDNAIFYAMKNRHLFGQLYTKGSRTANQQIVHIIKCLIMSQDLATLFRLLSRPDSQYTYRKLCEIVGQSRRPERSECYTYYMLTSSLRIAVLESLFNERGDGFGERIPCTMHLSLVQCIPRYGVEAPNFGWLGAYRLKTLALVKTGQMSAKESLLYHEAEHAEDRQWGYCLWDKERMELWRDHERLNSLPDEGQAEARRGVTSLGAPVWVTTRLNP